VRRTQVCLWHPPLLGACESSACLHGGNSELRLLQQSRVLRARARERCKNTLQHKPEALQVPACYIQLCVNVLPHNAGPACIPDPVTSETRGLPCCAAARRQALWAGAPIEKVSSQVMKTADTAAKQAAERRVTARRVRVRTLEGLVPQACRLTVLGWARTSGNHYVVPMPKVWPEQPDIHEPHPWQQRKAGVEQCCAVHRRSQLLGSTESQQCDTGLARAVRGAYFFGRRVAPLPGGARRRQLSLQPGAHRSPAQSLPQGPRCLKACRLQHPATCPPSLLPLVPPGLAPCALRSQALT